MSMAIWLAACSSSGATVSYTGREHPRAVATEQIESHAGGEPLPGYRVIGVVTARCTLLEGASGVFESPCTQEAMLGLARERASIVGGHALVDSECRERLIDKMLENVDGGSVETTTRTEIVCQATVARRERGAPAPARRKPSPSPLRATEHIDVGGTRVGVSFERAPAAPSSKPRDERDVGELAAFPADHPRLGDVIAECASDCARSTAFRAVRKKAAQVGALSIAELRCEPIGQRWRCRAALVGER